MRRWGTKYHVSLLEMPQIVSIIIVLATPCYEEHSSFCVLNNMLATYKFLSTDVLFFFLVEIILFLQIETKGTHKEGN